jgi:hypothetical protein
MKKSSDEMYEKFTKKICKFMDSLPEEDKAWIGISLCRDVIISTCDSHMAELGFIEMLKDDCKDFFEFMREEDKKAS